MSLQVELGAVGGFTLDDPVRGVLDNIDFRLGGIIFEEVTEYVAECVISRGKNRELQRFQAGKLRLDLRNQNREFDPLFPNAQYAGKTRPRQPVRVTYNGERIFTGIVADWNYNYEVTGTSSAEVEAVDELSLIAQQELIPGTAVPQSSGERVEAILNQESVDWPALDRNIDPGSSQLGADVFSGNALRYLQTVAASEQGQLFVNRAGNIQFRGRLDATPSSDSFLTFADDGTGIPYTEVNVNYGTDLLFNRSVVSGATGSVAANNLPSQRQYGITEFDLETLLDSTDQLENLASFIVSKYGEPELRFEALQVSMDGLTTAQQDELAAMELGDVILVKFTPNQVGPANPMEQFGQVIRLDHDIRIENHNMIVGVASLAWNFLILDDAEFGIMDTNHLAF